MIEKKGLTLTIFGCGYIGSAFARRAIEEGMCVAALTRNHDTANKLRDFGVSPVVEAELNSSDWYRELNPQQDFVLNCVGSAGDGLKGYIKSYFQGQASILAWASGGRIGTFVYTSSTSVYPQSDGNWISESNPHNEVSPYGRILLDAEQLLLNNPRGITRYFILRLAGIYGPERHRFLDQLRQGESIFEGSGKYHLNLAHRDDICSAIHACLFASSEISDQIFNIADDKPSPKKELVYHLADELGTDRPLFQSTHSNHKLSQSRGRRSGTVDRKISNKKIKSMLGWHPEYSSYKEGYQSILEKMHAP